jgi:hypothetical protein
VAIVTQITAAQTLFEAACLLGNAGEAERQREAMHTLTDRHLDEIAGIQELFRTHRFGGI